MTLHFNCIGSRFCSNPLESFDKSRLAELLSELGVELHYLSKGRLTLRTRGLLDRLKVMPCKCGCTIDIELQRSNQEPNFLDDSAEQKCTDLRNRIEKCRQEQHQISHA